MPNIIEQLREIQPKINYGQRLDTFERILDPRTRKYMMATVLASGFYYLNYDSRSEGINNRPAIANNDDDTFMFMAITFIALKHSMAFYIASLLFYFAIKICAVRISNSGNNYNLSIQELNDYKLQYLHKLATSVLENGDPRISGFEAGREAIINYNFNDRISVGFVPEDFENLREMPNITGLVYFSMRKAGIPNPTIPPYSSSIFDCPCSRRQFEERDMNNFIKNAEDSLKIAGLMRLMPLEMSKISENSRVPKITYADNFYGRTAQAWHERIRNLISTNTGSRIADDVVAPREETVAAATLASAAADAAAEESQRRPSIRLSRRGSFARD